MWVFYHTSCLKSPTTAQTAVRVLASITAQTSRPLAEQRKEQLGNFKKQQCLPFHSGLSTIINSAFFPSSSIQNLNTQLLLNRITWLLSVVVFGPFFISGIASCKMQIIIIIEHYIARVGRGQSDQGPLMLSAVLYMEYANLTMSHSAKEETPQTCQRLIMERWLVHPVWYLTAALCSEGAEQRTQSSDMNHFFMHEYQGGNRFLFLCSQSRAAAEQSRDLAMAPDAQSHLHLTWLHTDTSLSRQGHQGHLDVMPHYYFVCHWLEKLQCLNHVGPMSCQAGKPLWPRSTWVISLCPEVHIDNPSILIQTNVNQGAGVYMGKPK